MDILLKTIVSESIGYIALNDRIFLEQRLLRHKSEYQKEGYQLQIHQLFEMFRSFLII